MRGMKKSIPSHLLAAASLLREEEPLKERRKGKHLETAKTKEDWQRTTARREPGERKASQRTSAGKRKTSGSCSASTGPMWKTS